MCESRGGRLFWSLVCHVPGAAVQSLCSSGSVVSSGSWPVPGGAVRSLWFVPSGAVRSLWFVPGGAVRSLWFVPGSAVRCLWFVPGGAVRSLCSSGPTVSSGPWC